MVWVLLTRKQPIIWESKHVTKSGGVSNDGRDSVMRELVLPTIVKHAICHKHGSSDVIAKKVDQRKVCEQTRAELASVLSNSRLKVCLIERPLSFPSV